MNFIRKLYTCYRYLFYGERNFGQITNVFSKKIQQLDQLGQRKGSEIISLERAIVNASEEKSKAETVNKKLKEVFGNV